MTTHTIKLGAREFHVACPPEEHHVLQEAASLLDGKMSGIAKKTRNTGERLIVMAALELARDLSSYQRRLKALGERLNECE